MRHGSVIIRCALRLGLGNLNLKSAKPEYGWAVLLQLEHLRLRLWQPPHWHFSLRAVTVLITPVISLQVIFFFSCAYNHVRNLVRVINGSIHGPGHADPTVTFESGHQLQTEVLLPQRQRVIPINNLKLGGLRLKPQRPTNPHDLTPVHWHACALKAGGRVPMQCSSPPARTCCTRTLPS